MQNKPNFRKAQMNVNSFITKDYENDNAFRLPKNKPNSNPNKANQTQFQPKTNPNKANFNTKIAGLEPNFCYNNYAHS